MKQTPPPSSGKILRHGDGAGISSPADVARRAQENAIIDGRKHIGKDELRQAREELRGTNLPDSTSTDEITSRGASRDPSEPISDYGHEVPAVEAQDEQKSVERLVTEGVEEAQHDQMLAASRRKRTD
ncbi:hypothetical protein [Oleiharenicola lentus]|uniref:hypothetical protein n=1 Tax=Oleiharenicola lentus TaxID=2508720 RepID=UPI003F67D7CB